MNVFDVLGALNLIFAGVALARLRPSTFFFASNQVATLRALSEARVDGRFAAQSHLPLWLFGADQLEIAASIFTISTLLLGVFAVLPAPPRPAADPERLPALPNWLHLPIAAYFAIVFFSTNTVLSEPYGTNSRFNFSFNAGGLHMLIASAVMYELYRRVQMGSLKPASAFGLAFGFFFLMDFSKGQTGIAAGYLLFAAILFLGAGSRAKAGTRLATLVLAITIVVSISAFTRRVRSNLTDDAGTAVRTFVAEDVSSGILEKLGNGEQYAAHVLECIALYEGGRSREWRSVYNPILYTFEPSFLLEPLGITRPREAAWELADSYIHGGGIFVVGELYWNGGYLCVAIVVTLILYVSYLCDARYRSSFVWLTLQCQFAPMLLMGIGYGFAQVSRGFINGLLVLGIYYAFRALAPIVMGKRAEASLLARGGDPGRASSARP